MHNRQEAEKGEPLLCFLALLCQRTHNRLGGILGRGTFGGDGGDGADQVAEQMRPTDHGGGIGREYDLVNDTVYVALGRDRADDVARAAREKTNATQRNGGIGAHSLFAAPGCAVGKIGTVCLSAQDRLISVDNGDVIAKAGEPLVGVHRFPHAARSDNGVALSLVGQKRRVKHKSIVMDQLQRQVFVKADALSLLLGQRNRHGGDLFLHLCGGSVNRNIGKRGVNKVGRANTGGQVPTGNNVNQQVGYFDLEMCHILFSFRKNIQDIL